MKGHLIRHRIPYTAALAAAWLFVLLGKGSLYWFPFCMGNVFYWAMFWAGILAPMLVSLPFTLAWAGRAEKPGRDLLFLLGIFLAVTGLLWSANFAHMLFYSYRDHRYAWAHAGRWFHSLSLASKAGLHEGWSDYLWRYWIVSYLGVVLDAFLTSLLPALFLVWLPRTLGRLYGRLLGPVPSRP